MINSIQKTRQEELLIAVKQGDVQKFNTVLEKGVDINFKYDYDRTALHEAAFSGDVEVLKSLIKIKAISLGEQDQYGMTALHVAAVSGHAKVVKLLIEKDRTIIDLKDNYGRTALHCADEQGHNKVSRVLLKKNTDRKLQDNSESTALHSAVKNDNIIAPVLLLHADKKVKVGMVILGLSVVTVEKCIKVNTALRLSLSILSIMVVAVTALSLIGYMCCCEKSNGGQSENYKNNVSNNSNNYVINSNVDECESTLIFNSDATYKNRE